MESSLREKRTRKVPSKIPIDHSKVFFCFIFHQTIKDEKFASIAFGSPYWPTSMGETEKAELQVVSL